MKTNIITLLFLIAAFPAHAYKDFECTVKEVYALKASGLLTPGAGFVTPDVGSKFIVNRQTGQITSKKITNTMSGVMPKVYSSNIKGNSYTAITIYKPNYTVDLLQISEYVKAPKKPFIYKGAFGEVITGLCTIN